MKKFLTLRNVMMCSAIFVAILFFFLSFAINCSGVADISGNLTRVTFKGVVWGCRIIVGNNLTTGETYATTIFEILGVASTGLNLPVFFGILLPLLAAIALPICYFLIKKENVFQYVVLGLAALFVVGGILQFFSVAGLRGGIERELLGAGYSQQEASSTASLFTASYNLKASALSIISGIFTILAGGAIVASRFVKDKELLK